MAKFNVMQKERRKVIAERKRLQKGDPLTAKLKNKPQPVSMSGKRQKKLLKKWRRDQKEAIDKGLITMEDVEMSLAADVEAEARGSGKASLVPKTFSVKKGLRLKKNSTTKRSKGKGKEGKRKSSKPAAAQVAVDAMAVE